jgi:hypothetical protein
MEETRGLKQADHDTGGGAAANGQQVPVDEERRAASCDQESWVKSRIRTAVRMSAAIQMATHVRADSPARDHALEGILEGTTIEIIRSLGMIPEYTNVRRIFVDQPW